MAISLLLQAQSLLVVVSDFSYSISADFDVAPSSATLIIIVGDGGLFPHWLPVLEWHSKSK
jgi:hypothetical protein